MASGSFRFVDAHVHHWDQFAHRWYPAMQSSDHDPEQEAGLGEEIGGLPKLYLQAQYEEDAAGFGVTKIVHVAAGTTPNYYLDEARWIGSLTKKGWPAASIGTFDPALPLSAIEQSIADQAAQPGFRGVRGWFGLDPTTPKTADIFGLAAGAEWVFDLVIRPSEVQSYAPLLEAANSTVFVIEHAGWPETADPEHRVTWKSGIDLLAKLPNVHCKISGLPMTLQTVEASAMRPYVEACIEAFGVERCMVGSNFPVDKLFGSFADLMHSYLEITESLGFESVDRLFAANAEQLYRI